MCVAVARPVSSADVYEIPVILTLTGNAAFVGKSEQTALQLLEKSVNESGGIQGRSVHFAIHDSESNAQQALLLTNDILAQKPAVVMGSTLAADCRAMAPLFKDGPTLYCLSPGIHPDPGSYVFASGASSQDFARTEITYFRDKGWKRLALMFATDATGQDAEAGIKADLALPENRDMQVVELQHFNTADLSVAAQLARIKAANPDAMIAWVTGAPLGTILKGLQQVNLDLPFGTSDGNMSYAEMAQFASILPKQLYMGALQWIVHNDRSVSLDPSVVSKQNEFFAAYARAGLRPDNLASLGWDPASVVIDALRKLGPSATPVQIRDYLMPLKTAGVNGLHDFIKQPQRGLGFSEIVVTQWSPSANTWQVVSRPTGTPL
jgi:branched-chain amino acid transport system substrate-binding protein